MNRRAFLNRIGGSMLSIMAISLPSAARVGQSTLSTMRDASGWLAVIGQRGDVVIRISPRFLVDHPAEALHLMTTGRLP